MFHVKHTPCQQGLYVHVPFCLSKCGYCDFCRTTTLSLADKFLDSLEREAAAAPPQTRKPTTLYIGGGTPSALGAVRIGRLFQILNKEFDLCQLKELTVECNPDDVTPLLAETLANSGVSRVSMGAQSLNENALRLMGRRHSAEQVSRAIDTLRRAGVDNISVDIIFGLPEIKGYSFQNDIRNFISLGAQHLSAYALSYEEGSRFTAMLEDGKLTPTPDDQTADQYDYLCEEMARAGYMHYEISNFALPDKQAVHNSSYWDRTPYLGLGPAAASFFINDDGSQTRKTNSADIEKYCSATPEQPENFFENLSPQEIAEEVVMLRLRTSEGLRKTDMDLLITFSKKIHYNVLTAVNQGRLLRQEDGSIRISEKDWFVSNNIIVSLLETS